jgi:N-acetylmuramoyl-L-alanine amidase
MPRTAPLSRHKNVPPAFAKAGAKPVENASPAAPKIERKPLIVIDAGHGGQDPGAIGLHLTHEKDVTLNYARYLRKALLDTGRYRVALTREDDHFVMLPERVAIARKLKADIFLSFHADSNPRPEARGLSIYTLSETASDDEAAALAEHENKADIIPGIDLNKTDADVASILIDLTQRETMNKSAIFADAVVDGLHGKITKLQKTHRFAWFRVLKAPDIPSALIELGFLSNADDERLLLSPEYRDLVIDSVVKGIDRFRAGE